MVYRTYNSSTTTVTVKRFVAFEKNWLLVRKEVETMKYCTHGLGSCTSLDKADLESTFCPPNCSNDLVRVGRNIGDGLLD